MPAAPTTAQNGAARGLDGRIVLNTDYHNCGALETMLAFPSSAEGHPLPYAGGAGPGIGGRLKTHPEDFVVEELPRYLPAGSGEHLYLWIEKRGVPTDAVLQALRRALRVPPSAIGIAGRKDAHAVTRQWISVHTAADPDTATLSDARWRVLAAGRHTNKLRPGHLRGNRFAVRLRDVQRHPDTDTLLERLAGEGFPNYFGPQRVGEGPAANANALDGRRLLRGGRTKRGGLERHRFAVNAYQGALFNLLVARRLEALARLDTLLPGDWAVLHRNGAAFPVTDAILTDTQARAVSFELSPSAPLYGTRVDLAAGEPGVWERELLAREGLAPDAWHLGSQRLSPKGERRAVRALAEGLHWRWEDDADSSTLVLEFTLAPGVYATSLLREVMRNDALLPLPPPEPSHGGGP